MMHGAALEVAHERGHIRPNKTTRALGAALITGPNAQLLLEGGGRAQGHNLLSGPEMQETLDELNASERHSNYTI